MALSTTPGFKPADTRIHLTQTDAAATHGQSVACSGAALTADVGNDCLLVDGGTPGVTPRTVTVGGSATEAAAFFESGAIGNSIWQFGVWTVRINVTTGNANVSADSVYICRVNSAGVSQGTVASRTGLSRPLTSTGTQTVQLFQENDITAATTDRVYIVVVLTNAAGGAQAVAFTPNLIITTPIIKTHLVSVRRQRVPGLGKHLTFKANVVFTAPTVDVVHNVAAPTFVAQVYFPAQMAITGSETFPTE